MRMDALRVGDLIFYPSSGSLGDRIVLWRTRPGPYVHVEVCTATPTLGSPGEPGESIGAMSSGVARHALPTGGIVAHTHAQCAPRRLANALTWLGKQVNTLYGWGDVLDDGWSLVAPNGPFVLFRRRYDCSHLAALFLAMADYPLPADMLDRLALTTPNGLARAVGLLK